VAAPAPASAASAGPAPDGAEVLDTLLRVVAAKTGYDPSELDPTYELEADLGIDTVKQAEIFGEVRTRYGLARDDSFRLADFPTIEKLAGYLTEQAARAASGAAPAPLPVVTVEPAPVVPSAAAAPVAWADAPPPVSPPVSGPPPGTSPAANPAHDADDAFRSPEERLARALSRLSGPPVTTGSDVVIEPDEPSSYFGPVGAGPKPNLVELAPAAAPAVADDDALPASFRVRRPVYVERAISPLSSVRGRVVRVLGDGELAAAIREAVQRGGGLDDGVPEVIIDAGAPVMTCFSEAKALASMPPAHWLCAVEAYRGLHAARDSGARAGLAKALGREWPACHARVIDIEAELPMEEAVEGILAELSDVDLAPEVSVGPARRSVAMLETLPTPPHGTLPIDTPVVLLTGGTRGITARVAAAFARRGPAILILVGRTAPGVEPLDEASARVAIKARLESEGARVTPKRIEDALRPLRVAEEARQTVALLESLGADVETHAIDLADEIEVQHLVELTMARYGRIDVCVHGAGVEESRQLADKDVTAFRRVYAGKAEGGLALATSLPKGCVFVSMGSVAGRFGNPGQVDYAAANEAMARVCRQRPRSLHVCWTAWADVGMAVRGGMETLLTGRGVELLPADPGARLLYDLVAAGVTGEVLVAGRLGDFSLPVLHPLLDRVELDGDVAVGRRRLTLEGDPWIVDHAIDGVPVLPGVIGVELMVATALAALPRGTYVGLENVRFEAPLKLHRDEPVDIEVRAEPAGDGAVRCSLTSSRTTRAGRTISTAHFQAVVQLEEMPLLPALRSAAYPDDRISRVDIYRRFFHGPRFQVLTEAEGVAVQGMLASAQVEHAPIAEGLLTDPLVLEAAFQAAGLHRIATAGVMALPAGIDAVRPVRPVIEGDPLHIVVHLRDGVYDIDVDGSEGRVLVVRGFRMIDRGPLPPGDRLPEPDGGWPSISVATSTEARAALSAGEVAWATARGTAKRQGDRLAGQLAARRAVAALVGHDAFQVLRAPSGEPVVEGADVRVSISHVDGEAVALATRGVRAGVDLEAVEARHPGFATAWFGEAERARLTDAMALTRAWAVKEAVLKALGAGMALSPREIEVLAIRPVEADVRLSGEVAARHAAMGGAPLRVRLGAVGDRVLAVAMFAA
jgi:NAD(P)-dependent dehydrogenase (short-subunit alcohol dehydrogenase family)/phosphopantetheinyl transferase/3-hydroxymyristoyl/3-hydroxydecanoyl-(acyl carrier protein) dehydratase